MTVKYLSLAGFADRVGIAHSTMRTYRSQHRLPPPDAIIGEAPAAKYGWLPETCDQWATHRVGQGHRTDLDIIRTPTTRPER